MHNENPVRILDLCLHTHKILSSHRLRRVHSVTQFRSAFPFRQFYFMSCFIPNVQALTSSSHQTIRELIAAIHTEATQTCSHPTCIKNHDWLC
jgi:hypothetical protein